VHSIRFVRSVFDQIPDSIFTHFGDEYEGVRTVNFNTGKLYFINSSSFKNARDLSYFEVFNTKIGKISSEAFKGANNLETISIRQCSVGTIAGDAFVGLPNLKRLKLKGTRFEDMKFLENLPSSVESVEV
jgi:hypothetical protein